MENYHCGKRIGRGSYGEVWLVKSKRDKKQYVLKQINLQYASKRELRAANLEVQLLATLKHPNIVSYRDSFESHDGFLYIVMGYCEGGDLYSQIKLQKGIPFEESQVVEWFIQIGMALQYLHERNILHRDLKTQNIFLTKSKIIKVGDLGIAKVLDGDSAMATTLIGTPYYMSPELFSNRPYNHKSDVWALGCCIYEIATLRHAFNARDMNSLMYKIIRGKLPTMPKKYSAELQDLICALLNHNPDKRPSVSRILRHPYIKRNIAIFLEGTRLRQKAPCKPERSVVYIVSPCKPEHCPPPKGANPKVQEAKSKVEDLPWLAVQGTKLSKETETKMEAEKVHNFNGAYCASISDASIHSNGLPKTGSNKSPDAASGSLPTNEVLSLVVDGQEIKLEDRFSDRRSSDSSSGSGKSQRCHAASPSKKSFEPAVMMNGNDSPKTGRSSGDEHVRKITRMRCLKDVGTGSGKRGDPELVLASVADQCVRSEAASMQRRPNKEARQRRRQKLLEQNSAEQDLAVSAQMSDVVANPVLANNELPVECADGVCDVQGVSPPGSLSTNSNSDRDYEHLIDLLNSTLKIDLESPPSSTSLTPEKRRLDPSPDSESEGGLRCASRLELRITALESDCLQGLGRSLLSRAMEAIVNKDTKELQDELLVILGKDKYNDFIGKLWQLKLCQESIKPEDL